MTEPNHAPEAAATQAAPSNQGKAELEALRARAEGAERERDDYLSLAKRTQADFENYQKRNQRDLAVERRHAQAPLAGDLLSALDNLERAVSAAEQAGDKGALAQGVAMVQSQLLDALRRHGVTRIDALGKPFDPHLHQAVLQQPTGDHPASTVVQVLEQGYTIHDRVLRPARVAVSVAPPEGPEGEAASTA
jgi:molecular chaperone GrpE